MMLDPEEYFINPAPNLKSIQTRVLLLTYVDNGATQWGFDL